MCYKKPGPRCSAHARRALDRASERWHDVKESKYHTDEQKTAAYEKYQEAIFQYQMTPSGQGSIMSEIKRTGDPDGTLSAKLEYVKYLRQEALRAIKSQDAGDIDEHTKLENALSYVETAEGFPQEKVSALISSLGAKYGEPLGFGRHRVVFDRGDDTVVKVPLSFDGFNSNAREENWDSDYIPLAECWIEDEGEGEEAVPLLVMEKVTPTHIAYKDAPDWVMSVDGGQVGYTKQGKLVAYDL